VVCRIPLATTEAELFQVPGGTKKNIGVF